MTQFRKWHYVLAVLVLAVVTLAGIRIVQLVREGQRRAEVERAEAKRKEVLAISRTKATALVNEVAAATATLRAGDDLDELLESLAKAQAMTGDRTAAVATVGRVSDDRMRPRILADVASILSNDAGGLDESAFQSAADAARAASMVRFRVNGLAYVATRQGPIDSAAAARTLHEAIEVLVKDEKNSSGSGQSRWMAALAWKDIGLAQAQLGALSDAMASAERIPLDDIDIGILGTTYVSRGDVLVAIAAAHVKADRRKEALDIINGALAGAKRQSDVNRWAELEKFGSAQIDAGDNEGALGSFAEALKLARTFAARLNDDQRTGVVALSAVNRARAGDVPGAQAVAAEISTNKPWAAKTLGDIAVAIKESKAPDSAVIETMVQQAIATARGIADPTQRDVIMQEVAARQARAGDIGGSLQTAKNISEPLLRAAALLSIGSAQRAVQDVSGAIASFREVQSILTAADKKDVLEGRDVAAAQLAGTLAVSGDFEAAVGTARGVSGAHRRALALLAIVGLLIKCDGVACSPPTL